MTALGPLLYYYGTAINDATTRGTSVIDSTALQFSGALIAAIFWVRVCCKYIYQYVYIKLNLILILSHTKVALTCVSYFYEREGDLVSGGYGQ